MVLGKGALKSLHTAMPAKTAVSSRSSPLRDVSRGGVRYPRENVPSGGEQEETAVFAGYILLKLRSFVHVDTR